MLAGQVCLCLARFLTSFRRPMQCPRRLCWWTVGLSVRMAADNNPRSPHHSQRQPIQNILLTAGRCAGKIAPNSCITFPHLCAFAKQTDRSVPYQYARYPSQQYFTVPALDNCYTATSAWLLEQQRQPSLLPAPTISARAGQATVSYRTPTPTPAPTHSQTRTEERRNGQTHTHTRTHTHIPIPIHIPTLVPYQNIAYTHPTYHKKIRTLENCASFSMPVDAYLCVCVCVCVRVPPRLPA